MPRPMRLVLLSGLMLFVELALIRWTGSNVVFLSYFSNFVLLGSFLGRVGATNVAFGANLLGAMVGGVLEYVSLVTGYQTLLLLVATLYAAAFLAGRVHVGVSARGISAQAPI